MKRGLLTVALLALICAPAAAEDESKTWEGTWVNRKYNTKGALKCVATPGEDGSWTATFSGEFEKDPFSYEVKFDSKRERRLTKVGGTAKVRGHDYEWAGTIQGKTLTGQYKSSVGYYGEFVLQEKAE